MPPGPDLQHLREEIEEIDRRLLKHLKRRMELVDRVAQSKLVAAYPFRDQQREEIVLQRVRNDFPFDYVVPPQTPVLTDGVAIGANAPHPEGAKKFYEFVTEKEALIHQAAEYAKLPARTDTEPDRLPPVLVRQPIDAMNINWKTFAENEQAWCARWDNEVYQGAGIGG